MYQEITLRTVLRSIALVAVVMTASAACAAAPAPDGSVLPTAPNSPAAAESALPAGANDQGRLPKKLGEAASMTADDGKTQVVTFSIDKITVDPKCDQYMTRQAGTHTLVLDIRVATQELDPAEAAQLAGTINPFSFQAVTDGVTNPVGIGSCKATSLKQLPYVWASHSKYVGQIELEVPTAKGTLALVPGGLNRVGGGWEWQY